MNPAHICIEPGERPAFSREPRGLPCSAGAGIHRLTPHFTSNWEICLVFRQNVDNPDDECKSIG